MELRDVVTVVCLLLGAALVGVQLYISIKDAGKAADLAEGAKKVAQGAEQVQRGAEKVKDAAAQVRTSATAVRASAQRVRGVVQDPGLAAALEAELDAPDGGAKADEAATEAEEGAEKAAEGGQAANQWGVLDTLAGKLPLALTGLAFIALGAFVQGWIAVSASATTG